MSASVVEPGRAGRLPIIRNSVLGVLVAIATASIGSTGFLERAPNRLLSGVPVALWHAASPVSLGALCVLGLWLAAASFGRQTRRLHAAVLAAAGALLVMLLYTAGEGSRIIAATAGPAVRISLGPAFWIGSLCVALAIVDAGQRLRSGPGRRLVAVLFLTGCVFGMMQSGWLDALSIVHEYAAHRAAFFVELGRHGLLVLAALGPALALGVPLGLLAARRPSIKTRLFGSLNVLQTIPSIALFGLLIEPLSALGTIPAFNAVGIQGVGPAPAIIALVMYSLLPVVRNTEAGIRSVDPAVIEAACGMGFTPRQIFWRVEVPLAWPALLAGIRIVTVQAIGLAVVAALIGAGGLGTFVFQGLGQYAIDLILLGAVPTILLALAADFAMRTLIELGGKRRVS